jgi:DNA repair protein RadC
MVREITENRIFQVSEITLAYHPLVKNSERPQIHSSKTAYDLIIKNWDHNIIDFQEQFKVMLLNRSNRVLGISTISTGGITGTVADSRIIFSIALKAGACGIILAHNHPSGQLSPSEQDKTLTRKIVDAGKMLDIQVLDHVIITSEGYYSFADDGGI